MGDKLFISLVYNTSLLLVLVAIYSGIRFNIPFKSTLSSRRRDIITGVLIGFIGIAVMANPWTIKPGIFFDARSILLGVTGLFFGIIPVALAVGITGAFRIFIDGAGAFMGLGIILSSAGLGLLWQRFRPGLKKKGGLFELYLFGISVQLLMLACAFILPRPAALEVLRMISIPVMIVFPIGTVLLAMLLIHQRNNFKLEEDLIVSERDLKIARERELHNLRGLLPICASCKKIRDKKGYWEKVEKYIEEHSDVDFTHGICPDCAVKLYPEHAHVLTNSGL